MNKHLQLGCFLFFLLGISTVYAQDISGLPEMGMGIFTPILQDNKVVYLYENPLGMESNERLKPKDSIVFSKTHYNQFEMGYMPKNFSPEYVKLDYEILFLKVISMGRSFVEVEINQNEHTTMFVHAIDGNISSWESLIVNANTVVFHQDFPQKIKSQPMTGSKTIFPEGDFFMVPEHNKGDWLLITITDMQYNPKGKGWIQWKKDGKLVIRYKMLS